METRRDFIKNTGRAGIGVGLAGAGVIKGTEIRDAVTDEEYWSMIRVFFPRGGDFINLENGYFSPQPLSTLDYRNTRENYINSYSSWFMRREQTPSLENPRKDLAAFLGVDSEELAITRNTTESLNIIIAGYPWKAGDEVVIGNQDYGSMVEAFHQAAKRQGIVVKVAEIPLIPKNDAEVVDAFISQVTAKTRFVHVTHLINLTGQVLPVAAIADAARAKGVEVVVDAAHSVAHIDFKIPDLHADYVGASLHKWLCNPIGCGFLWMKKEHISKIWPLMADEDQPVDNIRKFEHQGTRPVQSIETISKAIVFHNSISSKLKQNRLKYLMNYWVSKVEKLPKVKILTPWMDSKRNSAIANIAIDDYSPNQLAEKLFNDHKIFTVAIDHPVVKGVRITPHIFTSLADLDALVKAVAVIAG